MVSPAQAHVLNFPLTFSGTLSTAAHCDQARVAISVCSPLWYTIVPAPMFTPLTPLRCLARARDLYGPKEAIVCGDRRFTYGQFADRCARLAGVLHSHNLEAGDRVAYLSFNTHKLLEGYFGVVHAAGIVMPLNVRLTPAELTAILNHSGARFLFYEADFAPLLPALPEPMPRPPPLFPARRRLRSTPWRAAAPAACDFLAIDENSPSPNFSIPAAAPARPRASRSHTARSTCTPSPSPPPFTRTIPRSNCTPSPCSTPMAGGARNPPRSPAVNTSWCAASTPPPSSA